MLVFQTKPYGALGEGETSKLLYGYTATETMLLPKASDSSAS
jgi:hypothetical protein